MSWIGKARRSFGGALGIAVAVAGGCGAAVGVYSLPDPSHFAVAGDVYVRADQRARAHVHEEDDLGYRNLWVLVSRGAGARGRGFVSESSHEAFESHDVSTYFQASLEECNWYDECQTARTWEATVPLGWFHFSPVLRNARFGGVVDGCRFDISWTGTGAIVPGAGGNVNFGIGTMNHSAAGPDVFRVALVDLASCAMSAEDAGGALEQGVKRSESNARVDIGR